MNKKKWLSLLLASSLFAADCCPPKALTAPSSSCKKYTDIEGRLFSAVPCINDPCEPCGMFVIADVSILAWQAIEGGLDFALNNNPLPTSSNINVNGHLIGPDFHWEPAVRGSLGLVFSNRAWDAQFRWTYFHTDTTRTVQSAVLSNTTGLFPLWVYPNAAITEQFLYGNAKGSLEIVFNGFDIEMGFNPYLTPALSMRLSAGLKVAQIKQGFDVHYSNGWNDGMSQLVSAEAKLSNNAIGAGPRLGMETKWHLGSGFSLLGSIAGSLPLWHYRVIREDIDQNTLNNAPQTIQAITQNRFWTFRSILETALGLGWDTCYGCRKQYPFGIQANYEFQYYSEQNMMMMLVNPGLLNLSFMQRGDLIFHGATLTFHLGF